jgi:hypothetical protein
LNAPYSSASRRSPKSSNSVAALEFSQIRASLARRIVLKTKKLMGLMETRRAKIAHPNCRAPEDALISRIGTGKVDFKAMFAKLKSVRFNGPVMVEGVKVGATGCYPRPSDGRGLG